MSNDFFKYTEYESHILGYEILQYLERTCQPQLYIQIKSFFTDVTTNDIKIKKEINWLLKKQLIYKCNLLKDIDLTFYGILQKRGNL